MRLTTSKIAKLKIEWLNGRPVTISAIKTMKTIKKNKHEDCYEVVGARSRTGVRGGNLIFTISKEELLDLKNRHAILIYR